MSRNAVFLFSVWTSLLSAVFYFLYGFTAFGVPWVMFVCLAIFFGMGGHVRDVPAMCLSALAGCVWGKVDFLLMDLFVTTYQAVCFPIYGIPKVRRSDYLVFDREDLPYLNAIEKFNCFYCSYGNGGAAY